MKKIARLILSTALVAMVATPLQSIKAQNVDRNKAAQIGAYFMAAQMGTKSITAENLDLVYEIDNAQLQIPALYVFNSDNGFVVVAGSECVNPIVAYSTDGTFDPQNIAPAFQGWLNEQVQPIAHAQNYNLEPLDEAKSQWKELENNQLPYFGTSSKAIVKLLTSTWNQEPLYNNMCPIVNGQHAVTGCVATAMAQIMYYWRFPYKGKGVTSFSLGDQLIVADFGSTYYDFDNMVDALTYSSTQAQINAVALLNYHCGVSVYMDYDPEGSGANSEEVPKALRKNFKYAKDSLQFLYRSNSLYYNPNSVSSPNSRDTAWVQVLRTELRKGRPIYYSAHDIDNSGVHAGHAFVCDGYNTLNGFLHFNWGWGGSGDCYCNVYASKLYPQGMGYHFTSDHRVTIGIQPPQDTLDARNVGIQTVEDNPFTQAIYPNPANNQITVSYSIDNNATMQILDMTGRLIDEIQLSPVSTKVTIPVDSYRPGLYICRINGRSSKFTVR